MLTAFAMAERTLRRGDEVEISDRLARRLIARHEAEPVDGGRPMLPMETAVPAVKPETAVKRKRSSRRKKSNVGPA